MLTQKVEVFYLYNSCGRKGSLRLGCYMLESSIESGFLYCLFFSVGVIITVDSCAKMGVDQ